MTSYTSMYTPYLAFLFIAAWMLESESCKSSINGEGEGEFRKELFSHLRGFTFLGPPFENLQGMFLIVTSSTISVFKHSSKEQGREGKHLANCLKSRFLNCILFLFYALTIVQLLRHWCSVGLDRRVRVVFSSNFPFFCEAEFVECAGLSASLFV